VAFLYLALFARLVFALLTFCTARRPGRTLPMLRSIPVCAKVALHSIFPKGNTA